MLQATLLPTDLKLIPISLPALYGKSVLNNFPQKKKRMNNINFKESIGEKTYLFQSCKYLKIIKGIKHIFSHTVFGWHSTAGKLRFLQS